MRGTVDSYRIGTEHPETGRYDPWRIRWELPPDLETSERRRGAAAIGMPRRSMWKPPDTAENSHAVPHRPASHRADVKEPPGWGTLRHSYATAALRAGVSPEVVSRQLGHSSVVVTLPIDAHVFEQDDHAAAETVAAAIFNARPARSNPRGGPARHGL